MKTITTVAQIAEDGILRLEVPCGLSSGLAEVAIVVHLLTESEIMGESPAEKILPDFSLSHIQADQYLGTDVDTEQQETNSVLGENIEEGTIEEDIVSTSEQTSLADFLAGYIGVIDSSEYIEGKSKMSEDTGKKFGQMMIEKREQGHL